MARTRRSRDELEFGERLRQVLAAARAASGKSARVLSKATDVSVDTIYALERGDILSPGFHTVYLLATEMGLDLDALAAQAVDTDDPATQIPRASRSLQPHAGPTGRTR
jgi:transcriptional regulator with XRE-family HTH domain